MNGNHASKTVREEVLKLIEQKEVLESEIDELQKILIKNNVGMEDPLVDHEGFPLPNVDVYQVRHARHLLICKQNDHKSLMKQIEAGISEYYKESPSAVSVSRHGNVQAQKQQSSNANDSSSTRPEHTQPIATISIVYPGSPADSAGIKDGDLIVEFGSVNATNFKGIDNIGTIVQHSRGNAINVKIKRASRFIRVNLVPREWNGRGLLGCNVLPFEYA